MRNPVDFQSPTGLRVVILERENGNYGFKTYYNNIKIDISIYDFDASFLEGLQKAIGEFLA